MAAEASQASAGTPTRPRARDLARRILVDPLLPILLLAAVIGVSTIVDSPWVAWMAFAAVAGHSLSGST